MNHRRLLALTLSLLGGWLPQRPALAEAPRRTLTVAAAADLKFALDELVAAHRARAPAVEVRVTYGSSGSFYAQLSNGAPFDLFLSADVGYPRRLVEAGLAAPGSLFRYATGRLVVWVPGRSRLDLERLGMRSLLDPSVRRIAIANPAHAPYGRAAEAAMRSLGVLDGVRGRLVLGESVSQAAQFVQSGNADAGLLALSLALAPELRREGRFWEVPESAYPRLDQGGVVLASSRDPAAARAFVAHLTSPEGRAVLARFGFRLPPP